ncbi:MAG: hypothetical protein ACRDYY_03090, partial [Acidimicrobiales bacterium]
AWVGPVVSPSRNRSRYEVVVRRPPKEQPAQRVGGHSRHAHDEGKRNQLLDILLGLTALAGARKALLVTDRAAQRNEERLRDRRAGLAASAAHASVTSVGMPGQWAGIPNSTYLSSCGVRQLM